MSNRNQALGCFISNPTIDKFYQTTDGMCWTKKEQAETHARSREDKTVTEVNRSEFSEELGKSSKPGKSSGKTKEKESEVETEETETSAEGGEEVEKESEVEAEKVATKKAPKKSANNKKKVR